MQVARLEVADDLALWIAQGGYLLTFAQFFGRLERLSGVAAPLLKVPKQLAMSATNFVSSLYRNWNKQPPVESSEVEQAEHFWYFDSSKAEGELGFSPRDPQETLNDTITYLRQNFLGEGVFR